MLRRRLGDDHVRHSLAKEWVTLAGLINTLCEEGRLRLALETLELLHQQGILISRDIFHSLLQKWNSQADLQDARKLGGLMACTSHLSVPVLTDNLIRIFALHGSLEDAYQAFLHASKPSVLTWHAILSACVKHGDGICAIDLYYKMQMDGVLPDKFVLSCMLTACSMEQDIHLGQILHHQSMCLAHLDMDATLGNSLIDMYAKCGALNDSMIMFDSLAHRDQVSWAVMISAFAQHGHAALSMEIYRNSVKMGIKSDKYMFSGLLKACSSLGALEQGLLAHEQLIKSGLKVELVVWSALCDMYTKCGSMEDARKVFDELKVRDIVPWSVMIGGFIEHGFEQDAFELFDRMLEEGMKPDRAIYMYIVKACESVGHVTQGQIVHDKIIKDGLEADLLFESALVDMYGKLCSLEEAYKVFDKVQSPDSILWIAMLGGYAENGDGLLALELFDRMEMERVQPCRVTLMYAVKACTCISEVNEGRCVHDQIIRASLEADAAVRCTLIDLYVKVGCLEDARKAFDGFPNLEPVLWAALIGGYTQHGEELSALELYEKMQEHGVCTDDATVMHALKACACMGNVVLGQLLHDNIVRDGKEGERSIGNVLVNLYASCSAFVDAHKVFGSLASPDAVSWGTMISAYHRQGSYSLVVKCYEDMQHQGVKHNDVIFASLLAACSHLGLLDKGCGYFKDMTQRYGIVPSVEQLNCMVDLLSRSGHVVEAEDLVLSLHDSPNSIQQTSLLTSRKTYGKLDSASQTSVGLSQSTA